MNGKVERAQKTATNEFYATPDLKSSDLIDQLQEWTHYYNWYTPHGRLNVKTSMDRVFELINKTPFWDEVRAYNDPSEERIREQI